MFVRDHFLMYVRALLSFLFLSLLLLTDRQSNNAHARPASSLTSHNVVLINSYHPQFSWTESLVQGIRDELSGFLSNESLHIEYMDGRRFVGEPSYFENISSLLKHKYTKQKPDLIITSDDYAFQYMLKHGDDIFPGVPVVFSGVNVFDKKVLVDRENYTGILEGMEIYGNFQLIRALQPETRRIIMLTDKTDFGVRMASQARLDIARWKHDEIALEIWDDFTLEQLFSDVSELPSDAALLMLAIHKDNQGQYFSYDRELPILAEVSPVPIYGMWGKILIGRGVMGGMMNDPYIHGRKVASVGKRILMDTPATDIPVVKKAEYIPNFDYNLLEKFQIDIDLLPLDAVVHFLPKSFYAENKLLVNATIAVIVLLLAIILFLIFHLKMRAEARQALVKLNYELEERVARRTAQLAASNKQLKKMHEIAAKQALTDSLTQVPNRRSGVQHLAKFIHRYEREPLHFSVGLFDIDHFKAINDHFGHDVGDRALKLLAECVMGLIRPTDYFCRWGGEEFLLLLPDSDIHQAHEICNRIRKDIATLTFDVFDGFTVSAGVAEVAPGDSQETLLKRADKALYQAKAHGRNCVMDAA